MATIDQLTHAAVLDPEMLIPISLFGQTMYIKLGQINGLIAGSLRIEFELQDGELIAKGETKHIRCLVLEGWTDRTAEVTGWSIRRDTGDAVEDMAWGNKPKAKGFNGEIDICFSDTENDIGRGGKATYIVTATIEGEDEPITEAINF